jgi:hypothetical protein
MTSNNPSDVLPANNVDLAALAQEQAWNDIKKTRAQITLLSLKKSMARVLREKEEEKLDNLEAEDKFNIGLAKEIRF